MTALARAATHDAISGKNSTICAVGGRSCGKSSLVFGEKIAQCISLATGTTSAFEEVDENFGLLGNILNILHDQPAELQASCSLSIVEVVDDDILRDVLGFSHRELNEHDGHALKLRHVDQKGAVLENLHHIPADVETMKEVSDSFNNDKLKRIWFKEGGHGHFIATICIIGEGIIQLVDCASTDRLALSPSKSDGSHWKQKHDRRVNSIRKSLSSLRGVFRGLLTEPSNDTSPSVTFRECTLTKLLQRCLHSFDGETKPRAVIIGAVSPSSKAYSQTLSTMDYTSRLLTRQGNTASDPFYNKIGAGHNKSYNLDSLRNSALAAVLPIEGEIDDEQNNSPHSLIFHTPSMKSRPSTIGSQSAAKVQTDGTILKSIVSDPRQRLARLLSTASIAKSSNKDGKNDDYAIDTPSSVASEDLQAEFQQKYGTVFDQLDTLMSADEDDIDKRSYGNSLIEALSEKKHKNIGKGALHDELAAKELFSPEVNSWSHEVPIRDHLVQTPGTNTYDGYFGLENRISNKKKSIRNVISSKSIPSVVICDDSSCRDTIISDRGVEHANSNTEVKQSSLLNAPPPNIPNQKEALSSEDVDIASNDSENQVRVLQSQVVQFIADSNVGANPSNEKKCESTVVDDGSSSDKASTESEIQIIQALQDQMNKIMMETDISYCSSVIVEEKEQHIPPSKDDIFVKSSSSKLLPLNMILSSDSIDSEPLLSCRSHATQIYGSMHESSFTNKHLMAPDISINECSEHCAFFKKEDGTESLKSDPLNLNHMMANFEKEINTLMQSEEFYGASNHKNNDDIGRLLICGDEKMSAPKKEIPNGGTSKSLLNAPDRSATQTNSVYSNDFHALREKKIVHATTQTDIGQDEFFSLKTKVRVLTESSTKTEAFIRRLQSIARGEHDNLLDPQIPNLPQHLLDLEDTIRRNHSVTSELKASLNDKETQLETALKSAEKAQQVLEEVRTDFNVESHAFSAFISEIDDLFQVSRNSPNVREDVHLETVQLECINSIKRMQAQLQSVTKENQKNLTTIDSLRSNLTDIKTECLQSKALVDTAQLKNKTLQEQLTLLEHNRSELKDNLQHLTCQHKDIQSQKNRISAELEHATQVISSRDAEIAKLRSSIQLSEQKLKSFGTKTAEVMKARIDELKAHHAAKTTSLNNTISVQSSQIQELENTVHSNINNSEIEMHLAELKSELSRSRSEKINLEQRIKQIEKSFSLKLKGTGEQLIQAQNHLAAANDDVFKQQSENKSLKVELAHLRDVMSIAEESVGELHRLRQENEYLKRSRNVSYGPSALSTSFESRGKRSVDSINFEDDRFVHERISALMRENEQSNISMRALQKENAALKNSIGDCHNELLVIRKDMKLADTARKSSPAVSEETSRTYTSSSLKTPLEHRPQVPEYYFPFASSTLQTEDTSNDSHLVAQLSAEKELRYKAEEICAGVLANAQAGYDQRDTEIKKLRAKLFKLSNARY